MKFNRKGDIGFPEAIMAVMIVTLVLSIYVGVFAFTSANDPEDDPVVDRDLTDGLIIENQKITGNMTEKITASCERNGYRGIMIRCHAPGDLNIEPLEYQIGTMDGDVSGERFLKTIPSDDGRAIPVIVEMNICA